MKHLRIKLLVLVSVLIAGWITYAHRTYVSAWMWHFQHGTSISVGSYIIPVPRNWYVYNHDGVGPQLVRLDTDDQTPNKRVKAHASILIQEMPMLRNEKALDLKVSLDTDAIKKMGIDPVLQRVFTLNDGIIVHCSGGYKPSSQGNLDIDPSGWVCSSLGLDISILATEPDMKQVWDVVSGMRRR